MGLYFNLNEDERVYARPSDIYCLIIYDIVSNKRRQQLSHLLASFGVRVQKSCFEIRLEKMTYRTLLSQLEDFYRSDQEERIRVYKVREDERTLFDSGESAEEMSRQIFL